MKFECHVDINLPLLRVGELFDSEENIPKWQDGFKSFEHLSGEKGKAGAKAKIVYQQGKREIELIETILVYNIPHEFTGQYEHKSMTNTMRNIFTALSENETRWTAEIEYTKLNGFIVKLMAFLFPNMFKKQVQKWLNQFKAFAESEGV